MTYRTETKLRCECGHSGLLRTAENDQPYSDSWFKRTVEGFADADEAVRNAGRPAA